jgi:hypothetical protein
LLSFFVCSTKKLQSLLQVEKEEAEKQLGILREKMDAQADLLKKAEAHARVLQEQVSRHSEELRVQRRHHLPVCDVEYSFVFPSSPSLVVSCLDQFSMSLLFSLSLLFFFFSFFRIVFFFFFCYAPSFSFLSFFFPSSRFTSLLFSLRSFLFCYTVSSSVMIDVTLENCKRLAHQESQVAKETKLELKSCSDSMEQLKMIVSGSSSISEQAEYRARRMEEERDSARRKLERMIADNGKPDELLEEELKAVKV